MPDKEELVESMVFVQMGVIHLETSFGHLRVDLKLDEVVNGYRDLWKLMVLVYKQQQRMKYHPNGYRVAAAHHKMQHAMTRLFGMVSLITSSHDAEAIALAAWADKVKQIDQEFKEIVAKLAKVNKGRAKGIIPPPVGNLNIEVNQRRHSSNAAQPNKTQITHKREKRQFIIAALAIGTLVSFGLSVYNTYELSNINTAIDAVHSEVQILAKEIDRSALKINGIIEWCNQAQKSNKIMSERINFLTSKAIYDSTVDDLDAMLDTFLHEIDDYISGITMLQRQRFSPLLVQPHLLDKAYDELLIEGTEHNLHPVSEESNIVFQSKVSVIAKMLPPPQLPKLYALIHVPFYTSRPLTLYRYHPIPILVGKVLMQFRGSDYLATSPDGQYAKEMTAAELQDCSMFGPEYHCAQQNSINRNTRELCLYSLFFNQEPHQKCDIFVTKATAYAHQIGSGKFAYTSLHPFQLSMFCDRNLVTPKYKDYTAGTHIITMTNNCRMYTTPEFVMMHNPEFDLTKDLIQKQIRFNKSMLEEGVPAGWNAEQRILDHFTNGTQLAPLNLRDLKVQFQAEEARYNSIVLGAGTAIASILITIILGVVAAYLVYRCCKNRKRQRVTREEWEELKQERRRLVDDDRIWRRTVPMDTRGRPEDDPNREIEPPHQLMIQQPQSPYERQARANSISPQVLANATSSNSREIQRNSAVALYAANALNHNNVPAQEGSYITSTPIRGGGSASNLITLNYTAGFEVAEGDMPTLQPAHNPNHPPPVSPIGATEAITMARRRLNAHPLQLQPQGP